MNGSGVAGDARNLTPEPLPEREGEPDWGVTSFPRGKGDR